MTTDTLAIWKDPEDGAELGIEAGSSAVLSIAVENRASKPRLFSLALMGIPDEWTDSGIRQQRIGALDEQEIRVTISPPAQTLSSQHRVNLRLLSEGEYDDSFAERNFVISISARARPLRSEPAIQTPLVVPEFEHPLRVDTVTEVATAHPVAETNEVEPHSSANEPSGGVPAAPAPMTPADDSPLKLSVDDELKPAIVEQEPSFAGSAGNLSSFTTSAKFEETPDSQSIRIERGQDSSRPASVFQAEIVSKGTEPLKPSPPTTPSDPAPVAASASEPVILDLPETPAPAAQARIIPAPKPIAPTPIAETSTPQIPQIFVNLPDDEPEPEPQPETPVGSGKYKQNLLISGEVPTLRLTPGEYALIRFPFKNDHKAQVTFVIEEDRSLEVGWIDLVSQQVNLPSGKSGEVSAEVNVPTGTRPATYQFQLRVGPKGLPLTPFDVTLVVDPVLGATVETEQPLVTVGPVARSGELKVHVKSTGNADTAYRVACIEEKEDEKQAFAPVYETDRWQYLIDKEVENLKSPASNRPPVAQTHTLTIRRKGIWWLGWVDKQSVTFSACPVTDRSNSVTDANSVDLTLKIWRILPVPWFVALALFLILVPLLGSGSSGLKVDNGIQSESGTYFVLGDPSLVKDQTLEYPVRVKLSFNAPFYAWLSISRTELGGNPFSLPAHDSKIEDDTAVPGNTYLMKDPLIYKVRSKLGLNEESNSVFLVPMRTRNLLSVVGDGGQISPEADPSDTVETLPDGKTKVPKRVYVINVDPTGKLSHVTFNLTQGGYRLALWQLNKPTGFQIQGWQGDHDQMDPGNKLSLTFSANGSGEKDEDWRLVTTDAACPVLVLRLHLSSVNTKANPGPAPGPQRDPGPKPVPQRPEYLTKDEKTSEPKHSILEAVKPATVSYFSQKGVSLPVDDNKEIEFGVWNGGSLLKLGEWAFLRAAPSGSSERICALVHLVGGKWQLVKLGPESSANNIKSSHPDAPPSIFGGE